MVGIADLDIARYTQQAMDFERLAREHKDAVYRQMMRVCNGQAEDAEDALAEAMVVAFRASGQLQHPEAFRAWLTRIGSRICTKMQRREARLVLEREPGLLESIAAKTEEDWESNRLKECVTKAISGLSPTYQEVYVRRELKGETADAVSAATGLSIPAIKSRLHRARALVREALDSDLCV